MRSLFVLVLLLGACTSQQAAVVDVIAAKVRAGNDSVAKNLIVTICGMTVGAYYRLESPAERRGVDLLCGGNGDDPITLRDLRAFLEAQK